MAEAIGLGASIIGIASAGISVVTALTKFGISYKESDSKIQELAARVSLTATILQAIGDTVEDSEAGFKKEAFMATWKDVLDACARNYEKLNDALSKAKLDAVISKAKEPQVRRESSKGRFSTFAGLKWTSVRQAQLKNLEGLKDGFSTWGKLKWALGGETQMKDLESSLEKSAQQVMMMQQVIQLTAIKLLGKSGPISSKDRQEQEELTSKMDWIFAGLIESGHIKFDQRLGSPSFVAKDSQDPRGSNAVEPFKLASAFMARDRSAQATKSEETGTAYHSYMVIPPTIPAPAPGGMNVTQSESSPGSSVDPSARRVFESYFIAPRSLWRDMPAGVFGITEHSSDGYMTIAVNTTQRIPSTLDFTIRDAEYRGTTIYQPKKMERILYDMPVQANKEIRWLLNMRNKHSLREVWELVDIIKMVYAQPGNTDNESKADDTSNTSIGYLTILRAHIGASEVIPVPGPPLQNSSLALGLEARDFPDEYQYPSSLSTRRTERGDSDDDWSSEAKNTFIKGYNQRTNTFGKGAPARSTANSIDYTPSVDQGKILDDFLASFANL